MRKHSKLLKDMRKIAANSIMKSRNELPQFTRHSKGFLLGFVMTIMSE
ncbi:hypothetical protein [Paenibacillus sp. N3.4]|nr:hypothetical protein [Paenibacillus sp. N3.4]